MSQYLNVGKVRIKLPSNIQNLNYWNLDDVYGSSRKHSDALLTFSIGNREIAIIIETTGHPEIKDFKRIEEDLNDLKNKGYIGHGMVYIKILHHKGIRSDLLVKLARSYRIELLECRDVVDVEFILRRRRYI